VTEPTRELLRAIFDTEAERYDRARPGYPPELFDDLAELAGIGPGCRLLEIGPGTGQATAPLAARGCRIVAVELGERLANLARQRLAAFANVHIELAAFEEWPLPAEPFDVVFSATAFHWIDPEVRIAKPAEALRPGGALAIVETHHVSGGTEGFFAAAQDCYLRFDPATEPGFRQPAPEEVPTESADLAGSGRFGPAETRRYVWERCYTTAEYLDLLLTYSNHLALPEVNRVELLACLARLIDTRLDGRVRKRYLTQLHVARLIG
jgi:SAM-dependent methyltransferase